ncbi:MAG: hypothetical protein AAB552_03710 [Patescibacteria group bacterium]
MEKKKKILLGGIIVAVVVVGVVISQNQISVEPIPEPAKTTVEPLSEYEKLPIQLPDLSPEAIASWPVCRNEKYGYEFKYPKGWFLYDTSWNYEDDMPMSSQIFECSSPVLSIHQELLTGQRYDPPSLGFRVTSKEVWERAATTTYWKNLGVEEKIISRESILNGEKIKYYDNMSVSRASFFRKEKSFMFNILSNSESQKLLDAVLSTFRFLE